MMKEDALKLADELDWHWDNDCRSPAISNSADMIRKLVAELDKQGEPVAWMMQSREIDGSYYLTHEKPTREQKISHQEIPLYTAPQTYCPSENNEAYEKGFIDGMQKQMQSRVDGIIGRIGDSPIHDLVHRTNPQTKPLSEEELYDVFDKWTDTNTSWLNFGRLIEERHGIK